jgi:beta-glucosidase
LSYTTFEYANLAMNTAAATTDEAITLSFDVKNTGEVAADEVAQIYLSPADGNTNIRPIQLQGFARVSLAPGETKKVEVKMYTEQFGYYSNEGQRQWNIAPGEFSVKVGASSQDIKLSANISLQGEKVVKPLRDYYFSESIVK